MLNKKPITIIAFGRSGCGKGTQLKLLSQKMTELYGESPTPFATGDFFRELFNKNTYTAKIAESITNEGKLQPLFLTTALWGQAFIEKLSFDTNILIDGFPRRIDEAKMLADALSFYGRENIILIDFLVTRETSKARMLKRGRPDDTLINAEIRLDWYDYDVATALDYFKNLPDYIYIPIDGERGIQDIHVDVINKLEAYL